MAAAGDRNAIEAGARTDAAADVLGQYAERSAGCVAGSRDQHGAGARVDSKDAVSAAGDRCVVGDAEVAGSPRGGVYAGCADARRSDIGIADIGNGAEIVCEADPGATAALDAE